VWRALEPGTAHPMQRLRAVRELVDAGIYAGVLMAPIVPGVSSKPALLATLCEIDGSSVVVSVPCSDEEVTARLEPGAASPRQRLRAVRELLDAGVNAGVLMSPIVPGISSKPKLIEKTIADAAAAGVPIVGSNVMHLQGGTREHFTAWLSREFPHLVARYRDLYKRDYAPAAYCTEVKKVIKAAREKHGANCTNIRGERDGA